MAASDWLLCWQELPEKTHEQMQDLPTQWTNTKKQAIECRQNVAPFQAKEVQNIRARCYSFDVKQHNFRERFRQIEPLSYNCQDPYTVIDEVRFKNDNTINRKFSVVCGLTTACACFFAVSARDCEPRVGNGAAASVCAPVRCDGERIPTVEVLSQGNRSSQVALG